MSFLVVCRFWKISVILFLLSKLKNGFYIFKFSTMCRLGNLGSNGTTSGIWIHLYSGTSGPGALTCRGVNIGPVAVSGIVRPALSQS